MGAAFYFVGGGHPAIIWTPPMRDETAHEWGTQYYVWPPADKEIEKVSSLRMRIGRELWETCKRYKITLVQ